MTRHFLFILSMWFLPAAESAGVFKNSTNFSHIAGDGVGIAMKHHVEMENLDYIQIHPTTLYSKKPGRRFLVSESVRGEGALLYDKNGQRFTTNYSREIC